MGKASRRKKRKNEVAAPSSTAPKPSRTGSLRLHLVLIAVLGLLAYSNTFDVPFQWDGKYHYLEPNPVIKDLSYFLNPSKAKEPLEAMEYYNLYAIFENRLICFLTFALNYSLHGLDVRGYHAVNLAVHITNALLIYLLVILTLKTPLLENSRLKDYDGHIALFSAMLFVAHPVQTQAVTYICQRFTSLAAFFSLLSLLAYVKARISTLNIRRYVFYALALISILLAMKTKENVFTFPLIILLYEFMFFKGSTKRRFLYLLPLLLTMLIIPLSVIDFDKPFAKAVADATRTPTEISRLDYLFTQFRVVVTYIRLLFIPVGQNADYDYPVFHSFFNPEVFLSFLLLCSILGLGIFLLHRSRVSDPGLRLLSFGVFWFFITLSVESGLILIIDVIFEHRMYLPSAGAFLSITTWAFLLTGRAKSKELRAFAISSFILMSLVFSYVAYARNAVWKSEITLWEDVVKKSPRKARGYYNLGFYFTSKGLTDKAAELFKIAIRLNPDFAEAHNWLGAIYISKGLFDEAIEHFRLAVRLKPSYIKGHNNLGAVYMDKGLTEKAIEHYKIAVKLKPDLIEAHYNLGLIYLKNGLADKARREFEIALQINPDYRKGRMWLNQINKLRGK
jgi:tetratricopeptide (TPR) repeat protein